MRSGEEDNGLSGKCFMEPELAHQKSENVGGTPEPFPLLAFFLKSFWSAHANARLLLYVRMVLGPTQYVTLVGIIQTTMYDW